MISFACGELGIKSLKKVYDMPFAEFQIRLFAYQRMELRQWEKIRFVAWNALVGHHYNPKRLPKTIEKFLPLDMDKQSKGVTPEQRKRFLQATEEYLKAVKNG